MLAPQASFAEWSEALYFATQYNLPKARKYIIDTVDAAGSLPQDDPTAVIQLADRCKVNAPWLLPQYVAVCERNDTLSDDEAGRLTVQALIAVSRIREKRARLEALQQGGEAARAACCCGKSRANPCHDGRFNRTAILPACKCAPHAGPPIPATADLIRDEPYLLKRTSVEGEA